MRLLLGLVFVSTCLVGGGVLAWKGLELSEELAPDMEYWKTSSATPSSPASAVVVVEPEPAGVKKESSKSSGEVRRSRTPAVMLPLPGANVIAVPDNARAGSDTRSRGGTSDAAKRASSGKPRVVSPGIQYGLHGRSELTRALDQRWHSKPRMGFTSETRKRDQTSGKRVRSIRK